MQKMGFAPHWGMRLLYLFLTWPLLLMASCNAVRLPFSSKKPENQAVKKAKAAPSGLPKPDEQTGHIQLSSMEISPTGEPTSGGEATTVSGGVSPSADSLPALQPPPEVAVWEQLGKVQGITTQIEDAKRTGKVLLLFFQNSKLTGGSTQLREAVLNHPSILAWKQNRMSVLELDYGAEDGELKFRDRPVAKTLLQRYKIRGYPSLVLVLPDGTSVVELKGWREQKRDRFLTELQLGMKNADQKMTERRKQLAASGYQQWHGTNGKTFFGKMVGKENGQIILQNEWGSVFQVPPDQFIEAERAALN